MKLKTTKNSDFRAAAFAIIQGIYNTERDRRSTDTNRLTWQAHVVHDIGEDVHVCSGLQCVAVRCSVV